MKQLTILYYTFMVLAVAILSCGYFLITKQIFIPLNPLEDIAITIQYCVLFAVLIGIPFALWYPKYVCKKRLSAIEDKAEQEQAYIKISRLRIVIVGLCLVLASCAYILMGCYKSMIWLTAITAIAWYFTKPTEGKKALELSGEDY